MDQWEGIAALIAALTALVVATAPLAYKFFVGRREENRSDNAAVVTQLTAVIAEQHTEILRLTGRLDSRIAEVQSKDNRIDALQKELLVSETARAAALAREEVLTSKIGKMTTSTHEIAEETHQLVNSHRDEMLAEIKELKKKLLESIAKEKAPVEPPLSGG